MYHFSIYISILHVRGSRLMLKFNCKQEPADGDITKPRNSETKHGNSEAPKRDTETSEGFFFFSFFLDQRNSKKKIIVFNIRERSGRDRGVFLIVNLHEVNSICLP